MARAHLRTKNWTLLTLKHLGFSALPCVWKDGAVTEMDESSKLVETTSQEAEPKPDAIVEEAEKSTATNVTGNYFI